MIKMYAIISTKNFNSEIKGLMKEALNECDLKAEKQKQMMKDLKNLKIEDSSASDSDSWSDSSDDSDQELKSKVLKKIKKVSVLFDNIKLQCAFVN